jgi:hypothetical protein
MLGRLDRGSKAQLFGAPRTRQTMRSSPMEPELDTTPDWVLYGLAVLLSIALPTLTMFFGLAHTPGGA